MTSTQIFKKQKINPNSTKKAVVLLSGGLDSLLAARVVLEQGIELEGINFFTGFCVEGHTHAIRNKDKKRAKPKRNNALWCAEQLGIKLNFIDIIEQYKSIVINPKYGYGATLNPCLDCKIFMLKKAYDWIQTHGFDFIITGEVVGQRPMSQRRDTMPLLQKESGVGDLLLRPLCAKKLPLTLPERQGWIDRQQLYGFNGRSRKPQIKLAAEFGFENYAQPAGGCCFLTDHSYAKKIQDLWNTRGKKQYELDDIMLLKVGRHLRPSPDFKIIISRDAGETQYLQGYKQQFTTLTMTSHRGPLILFDGKKTKSNLQLAAQIGARYGQGRDTDKVEFKVLADAHETTLAVTPMAPEQVLESWHI